MLSCVREEVKIFVSRIPFILYFPFCLEPLFQFFVYIQSPCFLFAIRDEGKWSCWTPWKCCRVETLFTLWRLFDLQIVDVVSFFHSKKAQFCISLIKVSSLSFLCFCLTRGGDERTLKGWILMFDFIHSRNRHYLTHINFNIGKRRNDLISSRHEFSLSP
jgi:hypothetical protein